MDGVKFNGVFSYILESVNSSLTSYIVNLELIVNLAMILLKNWKRKLDKSQIGRNEDYSNCSPKENWQSSRKDQASGSFKLTLEK